MPKILQEGDAGYSADVRTANRSFDNFYLTQDDMEALLQVGGIDAATFGASNTYRQNGSTSVRKDNDKYYRFNDYRTVGESFSNTVSFNETTGTTSSGTSFVIPAFESFIDMGKIGTNNPGFGGGFNEAGFRSAYSPDMSALEAQTLAFNEYLNYVAGIRQEAEKADRDAALGAQTGAFQNIVDTSAASTEMFIDAETVSPDETETMFSDLAGYTGTGGGARPDAGAGAFYDRTAGQQQSTLDAAAGDPAFGDMDPRLADATVQGQVQIRNDITGAVETINQNTLGVALSLLEGLGIDSSTLVPEYDEVNQVYVYKTPEGKDISSLISNLGASIEERIGGVAGDVTGSLGYGGEGQDTLFSDIEGLGSAIGDVRGDISGISTLDQQDVQTALEGQFTSLTDVVTGVGGQVTDVQTTVDDVEAAVGVLDERQLEIVQDLADLGLDTGTIIDALGRVETAVGAGGTLEQQIANKAAGIQQAVSGVGGQVTSGFGNQASQISGLEGGASAAALSQVAGDLGNIQEGQDTQAETLGTLATAEGQQSIANTVEQVKTATEGVDAAIKNNVVPEFKEIFDIFDDQGNLLTNVQTATGNIQTSVDENGNILVEKFSDIGDDIANIDLSNLDESDQLATLTSTIGNAAATFTKDYSSMETNIAGDRAAILKAIQDDSSALDTLIDTGIPQSIETEFGTYEAKIGENNELLVTKIDQAVDLTTIESTVDDIKAGNIATLGELNDSEITALANAVGYNASDLVSSVNEGRLSQEDLTALSTLTSDDITNAVDLSGVATSTGLESVAVNTFSLQAKILRDIGESETAVSDLVSAGTTTVGDSVVALRESTEGGFELVATDTEGVETKLGEMATATAESIEGVLDSVGQVGTAVQGQAVSLGNINNIKGDVTTLLAKAEEDLAANTARDNQISGVREDMLDALDDEIRANEAVVRNLLAGQTQTIQGDLNTYTVSFDRESGKLTAQAIDRQTLALGADIDAGTRQLTTDATNNTNYLERKVLEAKEKVEGKIGTAFDQNGELISSGLTANGEEIQRVLDAEGKLTETVIATNGTVKDTIVTNLSTVLDDTGKLNQAAIDLAQQGSDIEQKQTYFNALGGLIREDVDTMGRRITREIDSSGQFVNETLYYEDGSRRGTRMLRIQDILDKIFPSDPLAKPEDLTASDRRFLQGFRAEGLMGFG
jgi:uncharacterized protein YkvS